MIFKTRQSGGHARRKIRLLMEMSGIVMTTIGNKDAATETVFRVQIAFHPCERMKSRNILRVSAKKRCFIFMETAFFRAGDMITRFRAIQSGMIRKIFQSGADIRMPGVTVRMSGKRYFLHVVAC